MFPKRLLLVVLLSQLVLTAASLAQDTPDLAQTKIAVEECDKLHVVGLEDTPFILKHGPAHHTAWKESAEKGDKLGQWLWGRCLQEGVGGPANPPEAMRWYRKAADKKEGLGMNSLGENYERGIGVTANAKTAVSWYRKGKANGCGPAAINLGRMLMQGKGVEKDYLEAAKCFLAAAQGGYSEGARGLGEIAEKGYGLEKPEKTKAIHWYQQAVDMGNKDAEKDLARVKGTDSKTANKPPRDSKPPKSPPAGKPPVENKPPANQQFRGRPAPGIAVHPLGPAGFHGPAPVFAGNWTATLRNEEIKADETKTYTFDAKGTPVWRGTPMTQVGKKLSTEPISKPGDGFMMMLNTSLEFVSVQPERIEYILWETLDYSQGGFSNSQYYLKRYIFTPVAGNADRIRMEVWINGGKKPSIQGELLRVKGGD